MNASFEVNLKTSFVNEGKIVRSLSGLDILKDIKMLPLIAGIMESVSVYETDQSPESLQEMFSTMFGRPLYFIGYYGHGAKEIDQRTGKTFRKNEEKTKLEENGWMFFGLFPKGGSKGRPGSVDLSLLLKK